MACYKPRYLQRLDLQVPCGKCFGCLQSRANQWAIRCMHEASLHAENCFITLTYSADHIPSDGGLDRGAFQKFMKRLRKRIAPQKVRYFHAGEYGSTKGRPHYHALLFGFAFPDRIAVGERRGHDVFRSPLLEKVWPFGLSEIGSLTWESAGYVARYVMKHGPGRKDLLSVDLETGETLEEVEREYATMSRNPGIGAGWIEKWRCDVYPRDGVVVRGRVVRPPRYYDLKSERVAPEEMAEVRARRRDAVVVAEGVPSRLVVREKVARARVAQLTRKEL